MVGQSKKDPGFANRVFESRQKLRLSQMQLAKKIGSSKGTIQNYEAGTLPKGEYAINLAKVFDCSIDWLLTGLEREESSKLGTGDTQLPKVIIEHQDIIRKFDDPILGKMLNEHLIEIQETDETLFQSAIQSIKSLLDVARALKNAKGQVGIRPTDELIRKVEGNKARGGKEEGDTGKEGTNDR